MAKYTKKEIMEHIKAGKNLNELYNPNGIEISGGIPSDFGDQVTVEPTNSGDKEEVQAFNKQDKYGMFRGYTNLIRRESIERVIESELDKFKVLSEDIDIFQDLESEKQETPISSLKDERPDVFMKVEDFISDINSFEITPENKEEIIKYVDSKISSKNVNESSINEGKNTKTVRIVIPNEHILNKINSTPTLKRMSRSNLVVGENIEVVNHYQFSDLMRMYPLVGVTVEEI